MIPEISVSDEYLETVANWLEEWREGKNSWTIPQFLAQHGIGWSYFQAMTKLSPYLHNVFEVTVSILFSKWLNYAFNKKDLPKHLHKVLMKYLKAYDNHVYSVEQESKKELADASCFAMTNFAAENFANERLQQPFKRIYDGQSNKRRSRKSSKRV